MIPILVLYEMHISKKTSVSFLRIHVLNTIKEGILKCALIKYSFNIEVGVAVKFISVSVFS